MAKKAKFKFDGTQYDFEKDAGVVTYNDGKLNTALNGLQEVRTTGFGRQLLSADEEDFRRLLEISKEDIWDECQNRWSNNAYRSSKQKKFGSYSLYVGKNSLYTDVVFGEQPFTISFWVFDNATSTNANIFSAIGARQSFALKLLNITRIYRLYTGTTSANAETDVRPTFTASEWNHIEIGYKSGVIYCFQNGALYGSKTVSKTISREVRRIYLGSFAGYVDSFRILDGKCLHTAAFTAPSSAYKFESYPDETISLLNFE